MKVEEKISSLQLLIINILFVVGSAILFLPSTLAFHAKEDAWIVALLGGAIGVAINLLVYLTLIGLYPEKNIIQMYTLTFGKYLGGFFSIILCLYALILCSLILRGIGDFVVTQILPKSPLSIIIAAFMLIIILGSRLGIETIARSSEVFFPWVIGLFILCSFLIVPYIHFDWIKPFLEDGLIPIIKGTLSYLGFPYFECVLLLMLVPHLQNRTKTKKAWIWGICIGAFFLFIPVIVSTMVLGPLETQNQMYSTYVLAKLLRIPVVLERMEVIVAFIWIISIFFKLIICFYSLLKGIQTICKLSSYKMLTFPVGFFLVNFSIIIGEDIVILNTFSSTIWTIISLQTGFLMPVLLLLVSWMRQTSQKTTKGY
ncbi:GerAB/ArcD/ProY family transporter [Peribacillus acanthi]|uniref:GerAB/ArcD/ProY family transporter n=1 Tax=Peribacillus acanthi TaxID=2171554 RepID=UPI000D3EE21B|nr:endospore germination permease [Peribacillus acanthi]